MSHRANLGVVLLALLAVSGVARAEPESPALDSLLDAYTTTWNAHDGDGLAAFFTPDADLIMGNQPRITGREAIGRWWDTYFSRLDEGRKGDFEVLSQRDIAPGVRLVNIGSTTSGTNRQGEELEPRLARGTWVLVERDGRWSIAAMRGLPAEGEDRVRPGADR